MNKIKMLFEELEKEIKKQHIYYRCKEYFKGCAQCDFWKKFDEIKKDVFECLEEELKIEEKEDE